MVSMTDVYIVTLSVIGVLISFPGLAVALNMLLPRVTERATIRLAQTPFKSFMVGLPVAVMILFWIVLVTQVPFLAVLQPTAFIAGLLGLGIGTLGAAAMARLIGERIADLVPSGSELGNMVRGAVVYELAVLVPIVGWFLFAPLVGISVIGAAFFGLLGWVPRPKPAPKSSDATTPLAQQTDPVLNSG